MYGHHQQSQETLENFINAIVFGGRGTRPDSEDDARWNAQRGELVVSHSENLILNDQLEVARRELLAWQPLNPAAPSAIECLVLRNRNTTLGRILRDLGNFNGALTYFEELLKDALLDRHYEHTGQLRVILSNIADLYCELERANDAATIVESELSFMARKGVENIGSGRRLQLCLAEAYIKQARFKEAEETLIGLQAVIEDIPEPDLINKSYLYRIFYGLARLAHLNLETEQAIEYWRKALEAGIKCGWKTGYPMNILRYSLAHALYKQGDIKQSSEQLDIANANLDADDIKYWTVGLSTYWYRYVKGQFRMSESTLINVDSYT